MNLRNIKKMLILIGEFIASSELSLKQFHFTSLKVLAAKVSFPPHSNILRT